MHTKTYKEFGGRSRERVVNSCPLIDDRSNSASPTRRQPHPAGMQALGGFFGQPLGNEDRVLEWPPPEPRPFFIRPMITTFAMLGPRPFPPHNPNVWFFGPTANVQQLVFDDEPDIIEDGNPPELLHAQSSGLHRTSSQLSSSSGDEGSSEDDSPRGSLVIHNVDNSMFLDVPASQTETGEGPPTIQQTRRPPQRTAVQEEGYTIETPGISTVPSSENLHDAIQVQQRIIEPPPRQIVFIVMDTNGAGADLDDSFPFMLNDIQWAMQQMVSELSSESIDG
ncbi:unnamed protein product [Dibothriocephalus latus]|uniref:Uncharacterized protein n=1 Tax=Dibothriocephalus latus TaxID=60516 RepID=A0A3P7QH04_DIBLA|nr:unnamed protein product [Dibothriocephalus latus]